MAVDVVIESKRERGRVENVDEREKMSFLHLVVGMRCCLL